MLIVAALLAPAQAGTRCQTHFHRETSFAVGGRPLAVGFVDSEIYPIRVHYRRESDADRAANLVLPAVELSWSVQFDGMGWPAPPPDAGVGGSDAYDVYLTNDGTFGGAYVFGFGPDVIADDNWYSVPSYMALDDRWITDADMLVYVAHELNHASQYTIDAWEWRLFPWESTAEAIADLVDDESNLYVYGIRDFQELPFASLVFDGYVPEVASYDPNSWYEYGGVVFAMFLEERYGVRDGRTLLAMWDALAQPTRSPDPDFLDALGTLDPSATSAAEIYTEFAIWRMFAADDDDGAHFLEAHLWPARAVVASEDALLLDEVDGYAATPAAPPYDLGTSYYRVDLGDGSDQELRIEVNGDAGTQWGLVWALWHASGPATTGSVLVADGAPLAAQIPLAGATRAQLGVVNAGPEGMSATGAIPRRSFSIALSLVDEAPTETTPATDTADTTDTTPGTVDDGGDDGDDGDGDEGGGKGCGCAGVPSGTAFAPWLVLVVLARAAQSRWFTACAARPRPRGSRSARPRVEAGAEAAEAAEARSGP